MGTNYRWFKIAKGLKIIGFGVLEQGNFFTFCECQREAVVFNAICSP